MMPAFPLSWYAIHTRSKQEERAAMNLTAWGIEVAFPKIAEGKKGQTLRPLFPRYLFAKFDPMLVLHKVNMTRGILSVVSFGNIPLAVDDQVIDAIRDYADHKFIIRRRANFKPGDVVRVSTGSLRDLVGVFEREVPGTERVRILLTCVTYTLRLEANTSDLCKVEGEATNRRSEADACRGSSLRCPTD